MNKKKHQPEPNGDDSTESCDENQNMAECTHINKSVDLQKLKKSLVKTGFLKDCEECSKSPEEDAEMNGEFYEFDLTLWMCLKCGNQACGRARNQHALKHYNTPHSDMHSICVNTTMWNVWCYECDEEVNVTCKKKLLEAVDYLQKHVDSPGRKITASQSKILEIIPLPAPSNTSATTGSSSSKSTSISNTLPRARGLTNLGNTCFFNSVMQCLGHTPYLLEVLNETSESGQYFKLPGGNVNPSDKDPLIVEPLEGNLGKWKPLTATLAETLRELQNGRAEVFMPRMLLSRLTERMPQFGGGDQHDSHELLRHLLDAVREEDIKRYKAVILCNKGLVNADAATVDENTKRIIKFYAQQAESLLPTEQVFRGVLVSTLQCQDCGHTSHRDENFLDLSLPVSEKQIPPILRRKAEEIDDKPSRHQMKKEKRAERKKNKKQKSLKNLNSTITLGCTPSNSTMDKSDSESDADIEDNTEETTSTSTQAQDETASKGMESGYNSDKVYNSSPDSNNRGPSPDMRVDDSGLPSPAVGAFSASPASLDNSPSSSETNIDMESPLCGRNSPIENVNEEFDRPESRLSFSHNKTSTDIKRDLEKLILNDGDSNKVNYMYANDGAASTSNCKGERLGQEDEQMEEDSEDLNMWTSTFSAKYQCEEGECSVQSCLNQFTTWELMKGYNKVSCEICTKRHGGAENKTVYTNATKQLLIYNPPAVLILHLKRFQVHRFRSAKVSKYVKFPTLLDIGPFCSKRSRNLPTFEEGQSKVLYALYGVVEHSGSIHGGHYVSYIKVRSKMDQNNYRWQFLPKNQEEQKGPSTLMGAQGDPEPPSGKWYYISDSYVSEVTESKVLDAQAYLLFYERIM